MIGWLQRLMGRCSHQTINLVECEGRSVEYIIRQLPSGRWHLSRPLLSYSLAITNTVQEAIALLPEECR